MIIPKVMKVRSPKKSFVLAMNRAESSSSSRRRRRRGRVLDLDLDFSGAGVLRGTGFPLFEMGKTRQNKGKQIRRTRVFLAS